MPVSRQRKINRARKRTRSVSSASGDRPQSRKSFNLKIVVIVLIIAVAAATVAYVIANRKGEAGNEVTTASGLKYVDLKVGDGATPRAGQTVNVHYIGWLENGREFENSYSNGEPVDFNINQLIKGWTEALMTMKVGGKRRLTVPPQLAYGRAGSPPKIPPNATLTFEIELLGLK